MNETVMSGFFSAFFTFTQSLCGADVQDIELGPYRMLFEIVGKSLILAVIFDKADSIIYVHQKLTTLKKIIETDYADHIKKNFCKTEDFLGLNDIIDDLISKPQEVGVSEARKIKYMEILEKLRSSNEILDVALISINGVPLLGAAKQDFLDLIIGQMDAFWKFKSTVLDQIILYYENRYIILHKVNGDIVLCCFARRNTPIGLATLLVEEASTKISRIR
ncbi:MAG: hypothetical protein HWN66_12805 [Candidatus Helarchaeota archaeon]|nr:hypothetical protein [Candidatus Helarchaeota archaeon]